MKRLIGLRYYHFMQAFRQRLGQVIFETDTKAGRAFDVVLLVMILLSVTLTMLESVATLQLSYGRLLRRLEWVFTLLFTVEYFLRVYSSYNRRQYVFSFFGLVDLLAILPSYFSIFLTGGQYFAVIRILRLLRVFRILKMVRFLGEANTLTRALKASRAKITVFLVTVISIVVIIGSVMYVVEGPKSGFNNIPVSMYWAIVTLTTVGYGDIAPETASGRFLSALVMVLGYGIIAVPTGIVTAELARAERTNDRVCPNCGLRYHDSDANFCRNCGERLEKVAS
jgi:voltage-gated potassium channel